MKEKTKYEIMLEIKVSENIILGMKIENTVYKGPIKVNQQTYAQGSYAPSKDFQEAHIQIVTPGGIFLRGNYQGEAIVSFMLMQIKDSEKKLQWQSFKYHICVK